MGAYLYCCKRVPRQLIRGGLVCEAQRLLHHSTLGARACIGSNKKKNKQEYHNARGKQPSSVSGPGAFLARHIDEKMDPYWFIGVRRRLIGALIKFNQGQNPV